MSKRDVKKDGPHVVDIHVGQRMRLRRAELSISQGLLAERLDITFQQVQKYERGTNRVSASMLFDAANALSVSVAYFFVGLQSETSGADTYYLAATPRAHRLMRSLLELPSPIQAKVENLVDAIAAGAEDEEDADKETP